MPVKSVYRTLSKGVSYARQGPAGLAAPCNPDYAYSPARRLNGRCIDDARTTHVARGCTRCGIRSQPESSG